MSTKPTNPACDAFRHEHLRLTCDLAAEPTAEFRVHLQECAACRTSVAESRDVLAVLTEALAPEPLEPRFEADLRAALLSRPQTRTVRRSIVLSLVPALAAAACLCLVLTVPGQWSASSVGGHQAVAITPEDAEAIVTAYALLRWDSSADDSVRQLVEHVNNISQELEHRSSDRTGLPWSSNDDWDMPPSEPETSVTWFASPVVSAASHGIGEYVGLIVAEGFDTTACG